MAQNVTVAGNTFPAVPAVQLPKQGGGTALFTDVADTTAAASDVATGKYFYTAAGVRTEGTATGGVTIITDEEGDHGDTIRHITTGETVEGSTTLSSNGTHDVAHYATAVVNVVPTLQSKSVTPSETAQTVSPDGGYDGLSQVNVGAISSTYVGSGITQRSSSDLTASGSTVTAPAGYYSAQASKSVATATQATPSVSVNSSTGLVTATATQTAGYVSAGSKSGTLQLTTQAAKTVTPSTSSQTAVAAGRYTTGAVTVEAMPSGTAGTPTATKGAVSNHSVTVTPSVTNTTGYITGSTKTGTAVTVSASELVSGTLNVTENDTVDVTNYASVNVNVPSSGGSSYELIYSTTVSVSTTSTTPITVATIDTGDTSIWTSDKLVYVKIRDTAGWRTNYFYGMDAFCANNAPFNGLSATSSYAWFGLGYSRNSYYRLSTPILYRLYATSAPTGYGIYPTRVYSDGKIEIRACYSSSDNYSTQTIDGSFSIEVYLLDWPVTSPFNE